MTCLPCKLQMLQRFQGGQGLRMRVLGGKEADYAHELMQEHQTVLMGLSG